jgi:hypothetical protein
VKKVSGRGNSRDSSRTRKKKRREHPDISRVDSRQGKL